VKCQFEEDGGARAETARGFLRSFTYGPLCSRGGPCRRKSQSGCLCSSISWYLIRSSRQTDKLKNRVGFRTRGNGTDHEMQLLTNVFSYIQYMLPGPPVPPTVVLGEPGRCTNNHWAKIVLVFAIRIDVDVCGSKNKHGRPGFFYYYYLGERGKIFNAAAPPRFGFSLYCNRKMPCFSLGAQEHSSVRGVRLLSTWQKRQKAEERSDSMPAVLPAAAINPIPDLKNSWPHH
jgi:hypothetical protein